MILLYRGLIGSVLEDGSVCYAGMARKHILLLECIPYRALRISMGLMRSSPNNSLGVMSGIPQLRHRLFYLNFRYRVNTFQKNGHPLSNKLKEKNDLSPQKCLIPFHEVSGLDIQLEVCYTRHELEAILSTPRVNKHMEVPLSGVHANMYPIVALHRIYLTLMDRVTGFAVHHPIDCNIRFRMRGPTSIFTAELAAIQMAIDHIENEALGRYLILTNSMSSIRAMEIRTISLHTHPFVYE
jgi:hypothetical protein